MSYQIITDSSWDIDPKTAHQLQVEVIPFFIAKDGINYQKEVVELSIRDLYQFMVDHPGVYPKTAQPSINEYLERFRNHAQAGLDIICCNVNQAFSGSYNTAILAKSMIEEEYPDIHISVIDTTQATLMQGLIIKEAALARLAGVDFNEAVAIIERIKSTAKICFTLSNLDYLIHGGRVGKLVGTAANVLNLCPMISLEHGELNSCGLARGRKQARKKALQMLIDYIKTEGNDPNRFSYIVGYGYDIDEGDLMHEMLTAELKKHWPEYKPVIDIGQIGAAIGVYTGPYPIGFGIVERWDYHN